VGNSASKQYSTTNKQRDVIFIFKYNYCYILVIQGFFLSRGELEGQVIWRVTYPKARRKILPFDNNDCIVNKELLPSLCNMNWICERCIYHLYLSFSWERTENNTDKKPFSPFLQ
jgi:hypothetical protein